MRREDRYKHVLEYFSDRLPKAETELHYENPFQLIVAVVLSAQCTDKRVNSVTPALFRDFPDADALSKTSSDVVLSYIKSISYPNNKARHLVAMAKLLKREFKGMVPETVEELMRLPGVGRKTANVILSVIFNKPAMAVDTHVFRVSARLGLTLNAKNPLQCEKQLIKFIPASFVSVAHHWLILHGRYTCTARSPKCEECKLSKYCKFFEEKIKPKKVYSHGEKIKKTGQKKGQEKSIKKRY